MRPKEDCMKQKIIETLIKCQAEINEINPDSPLPLEIHNLIKEIMEATDGVPLSPESSLGEALVSGMILSKLMGA